MGAEVTYTIEGMRYRNHTLKDVLSELSRHVRAYLEAQSEHVSERRQAIDRMFEGAERRPTGPQIKHRRFELPFVWSEQDVKSEEGGALQVSTTAFLDTAEPRRLCVRTVAAAREVLEGVEITLSQQGPRIAFSVGRAEPSRIRWQEDPDVLQRLDGIVVQGRSARDFLYGKGVSEGASAEAS